MIAPSPLPRSLLAALLAFLLALPACRKPAHSRDSSFAEPAISGAVAATPREAATATALASGEVLITGGFLEDGSATGTVESVGTGGAVSSLSPLPVGRARHGAAAIEGGARVAVVGGVTGSKTAPVTLASTLVYDPAAAPAGAAIAGPDLPAPLSDSVAVFWDGGTPADPSDDAVFLLGGRDGSGAPSASVIRWRFSPAPGSAALFATLATPRAGHTATLCPNPAGLPRIYVLGGENAGGVLASSELVDPASGAVSAGPDLPAPRTRHAAAPVASCAAILLAGGLGASGDPLDDGVVLRISGAASESFTSAGRFGPPSFDLLALPQADGSAAVLGGFTSNAGGSPSGASHEAALFTFDPSSGQGQFLDLPDFDFQSGAGAPAGAARAGNGLGAEGTGSSMVLAGGRGSAGELLAARTYNPWNAAAARARDLTVQVGERRVMVAAGVIAVLGVIERTREYGVGRFRDIVLTRSEDPSRGSLVTGKIGEFEVELEIDGGSIHGEAAGTRFAFFSEGDRLLGDGLTLDLHAAPDDSIQGRYYLSWKRNSVLIQLSTFTSSSLFEGRIAAPLENVAIRVEDGDLSLDPVRSYVDSRSFDLSHSR
jgi:hypothetical protein